MMPLDTIRALAVSVWNTKNTLALLATTLGATRRKSFHRHTIRDAEITIYSSKAINMN